MGPSAPIESVQHLEELQKGGGWRQSQVILTWGHFVNNGLLRFANVHCQGPRRKVGALPETNLPVLPSFGALVRSRHISLEGELSLTSDSPDIGRKQELHVKYSERAQCSVSAPHGASCKGRERQPGAVRGHELKRPDACLGKGQVEGVCQLPLTASAHRLTQRLAGMGGRPARLLQRTGGQSAGTSRVNSSGNHGWSLNSNLRDLWRIWRRRRTPLEILLPLHRIRFVFYNVLGGGERGIAGHKWFHRGKGKGYQGLFLPL